jgi:hypothetical protein
LSGQEVKGKLHKYTEAALREGLGDSFAAGYVANDEALKDRVGYFREALRAVFVETVFLLISASIVIVSRGNLARTVLLRKHPYAEATTTFGPRRSMALMCCRILASLWRSSK